MNIAARLLKADLQRRTRLHDLRGNPLDAAGWLNIPIVVMDKALEVALGRRRAAPWISYGAARRIGSLLSSESKVVEFGAGLSTIWFGQRAQFVFSIESNPDWYQKVRSMLATKGLRNVRLEYRPTGCDTYANLDKFDDGYFDFALIDGDCRDLCVQPAVAKVRSGGFIYLDNTDQGGDRQVAEASLLRAPHQWTRYYQDFAPGLVAITQGLLVRLA